MISNTLVKTLIDFTLGDGSISFPLTEKRSARFKLEHSIKQREYLWHKAEILRDLGLDGSETIQEKHIKGKTYQTVAYVTKTHTDILTARKWTYNQRRKTIDSALLRQLDARSLAYWFMDDGSGSRTKKSTSKVNGKRYTYYYPEHKIERYTLATYNCTLDELHLIQDWLQEKFSVQTHIKLDHRAETCLGAFLSIDGVENKDTFRSVIEPYVIPSMRYKIEGHHTFKGLQYSAVETERENS